MWKRTAALALVFGLPALTTGAAAEHTHQGEPAAAVAAPVEPGAAFSRFPPLEKLPVRRSADVQSSRISVGLETLDRKLYDPARVYPHLAELGAKWARVQTGWARCETQPAVYDFAWLDEVVDNLRQAGLQPWFSMGYGNRLYMPDAPYATAVGWHPLGNEAARQAWLKFVAALAAHFAGRVKHYEIWNEPDLEYFWKPGKPDPAAYAELVKITAAEIRRKVPGAVIIGGALAKGAESKTYLQKCLEAGLADHIDVLSFHAYQPVPEKDYDKTLRTFRQMLDVRRKGIALWQGESGCPSRNDGFGAMSTLDWDETKQAKWLLRRLMTDLRTDLGLTHYFSACDMKSYPGRGVPAGRFACFGLIRGTDYTRKPAFYACQSICALLDADARPAANIGVRLVPRSAPGAGAAGSEPSDATAAAFVRNGSPLIAYWRKADLLRPAGPPAEIDLELSLGGLDLRRPILVDPLTQQTYDLREAARAGAGGTVSLHRLPLLDYPLVVTQR